MNDKNKAGYIQALHQLKGRLATNLTTRATIREVQDNLKKCAIDKSFVFSDAKADPIKEAYREHIAAAMEILDVLRGIATSETEQIRDEIMLTCKELE